jgi:hypothetical protein
MTPAYKWTVIFIISTIAVIAGYDVWTISVNGLESSVSHTMIVWAYKYPIFPFVFGVVVGHLFWRMRDTPDTKKISDFIEGQGPKSS